jgi:hypothetical protein
LTGREVFASAVFRIEMQGVIPDPPLKRNGVVHPVGGAPVDHALDRDLVGGVESRRAGEGVAANEPLPVDLDAEAQELPRLVGEAIGQFGGNVEHDRLAVVGFLDHVGDAEIEIRATGLGTSAGGVHG